MIALWAIAPLHHPLNRCAVTGGALRRVLVEWRVESAIKKTTLSIERYLNN